MSFLRIGTVLLIFVSSALTQGLAQSCYLINVYFSEQVEKIARAKPQREKYTGRFEKLRFPMCVKKQNPTE